MLINVNSYFFLFIAEYTIRLLVNFQKRAHMDFRVFNDLDT